MGYFPIIKNHCSKEKGRLLKALFKAKIGEDEEGCLKVVLLVLKMRSRPQTKHLKKGKVVLTILMFPYVFL